MTTSRVTTSRLAAIVGLCLVTLGACGDNGNGNGAPPVPKSASTLTLAPAATVFVGFYPIEEIVRAVGGSSVLVVNLTPAGDEAHELQLAPSLIADLERADAILYLGKGFQPALQQAAAQLPQAVRRVDLLDRVELLPAGPASQGGLDPHVWLDPQRMSAWVDVVRDTLIEITPGLSLTYNQNAQAYKEQLAALDRDLAAGLAQCRSRVIVTSHRAFGYLAARYGLDQLAIAGVTSLDEPSPKTLEAVAAEAKKQDVKTVFFETLGPKDLAEAVAAEIGAETDSLNPIEGLTKDELGAGETYVSVMRKNLAALRKGLDCE